MGNNRPPWPRTTASRRRYVSPTDEYPAEDWPSPFNFNGELMPKWAAWWAGALVGQGLDLSTARQDDVHDRETFLIWCRIDHVGVVESADPGVFPYAVQQLLVHLLDRRDDVLKNIAEYPAALPPAGDVDDDLVEGAFRMRQSTLARRCAFWTSGNAAAAETLVEWMRRSSRPPDFPDYKVPPHISKYRSTLRVCQERQVIKLHRLVQSGRFEKEMRRKLSDLRMD